MLICKTEKKATTCTVSEQTERRRHHHDNTRVHSPGNIKEGKKASCSPTGPRTPPYRVHPPAKKKDLNKQTSPAVCSCLQNKSYHRKTGCIIIITACSQGRSTE